jgi:HSP20 family molecular chaperone IbpA
MSDQNPKIDPMKELANLRDTVSKVVEKGSAVVGKAIEQGVHTVQNAAAGGGTGIKVDVYELENQIVIRTSPIDGLVAESIEVSMEGTTLMISGETREEEVPAGANFLLRERKFGIFQRGVVITIPVRAQEAKAKLNKNSALTVTLPIDQANYQRTINIAEDDE